MTLLPLFICFLLRALSAQAEVVTSFSLNCNNFFYEGKEPAGMDQNAVKICQKYNNNYYFATLYSTHHRIPLYSAYTLNKEGTNENRPNKWFIEPQLSNEAETQMSLESEWDLNEIKEKQAINADYEKSGYDRGHLNPNCFQCGDDQIATFTLTNAAPLDPCFNRVHWYQWERTLKKILEAEMKNPDVTTYIVTGTVPHPNYRMPRRPESDQSQSDSYERVTVPTHIWTAVCVSNEYNPELSYSFAYIGLNLPDTTITPMPVSELNSVLSELYEKAVPGEHTVKIFTDDCFSDKKKYKKVISEFKMKIKPPTNVHIADDVREFFKMPNSPETSQEPQNKKNRYINQKEYFADVENIKRTMMACVLTLVTGLSSTVRVRTELRKRDVDQSVECEVVPEKSKPEVMTAADGSHCISGAHYCKTENGLQFCCTTPCLYQEQLKDYRCYSGQIEIQCSPQYSAITVDGEKCKDDHQCATYGENYYWCYKESGSWDYCMSPLRLYQTNDGTSCRPGHTCGNYGKKYLWCYTDFDDNWDYC